MSNEVVNKRNHTLIRWYMIASICVQAISLIAFAIGIMPFYGRTMNTFGAVQNIIGIISMKRAYFRGLTSFAVGILHIFVLFTLIKNIIKITKVLRGKYEKIEDERLVIILSAFGIECCTPIFAYIFVCGMVSGLYLTAWTVILVFLHLILFVASRALLCIINEYTLRTTLMQAACFSIYTIALLMVLLNCNGAYLYDLYSQVRHIFRIMGMHKFNFVSFLLSVIQPLAYIHVVIRALCIWDDFARYNVYNHGVKSIDRHGEFQKGSIRVLCYALICPVVSMAQYIASARSLSLDVIKDSLSGSFAIICAAVVLVVASYITETVEKKNDETAQADEQPAQSEQAESVS